MYKHVKTGCKHIPPSEQPLQFQSEYFFNKPMSCPQARMRTLVPSCKLTRKWTHAAYYCVSCCALAREGVTSSLVSVLRFDIPGNNR